MRQVTNLQRWNKSFEQYPENCQLEVARCNGLLISYALMGSLQPSIWPRLPLVNKRKYEAATQAALSPLYAAEKRRRFYSWSPASCRFLVSSRI